jgi:hypothetical protein
MNAAQIEAMIDARVAAAMAPPAPKPAEKLDFLSATVRYHVTHVHEPVIDKTMVDKRPGFRASVLHDNTDLSEAQAVKIAQDLVEKFKVPIRFVAWDTEQGVLNKPEILIVQQLYARGYGETSEKPTRTWRFKNPMTDGTLRLTRGIEI